MRYYTADLITETLSGGWFIQIIPVACKRKQLFSNIECYHFSSTDAGLLTIEGKLVKGVKMEKAEAAVNGRTDKLQQEDQSAELDTKQNRKHDHRF